MVGTIEADRKLPNELEGERERERKSENDRKMTSTKIRYDKAFHSLGLSLSVT